MTKNLGKKFANKIALSLCCIVISTMTFTHADTNGIPSPSLALHLMKDINKLYTSLLTNHLHMSKQQDILCKEIPSKIEQYENIEKNNTQASSILANLKDNIEQTRKHLNISCSK